MFIKSVFAQTNNEPTIIGTLPNPLENMGGVFPETDGTGGLILLLNNGVRLIFIGAGLYALINIFIAGAKYMTAGGDPQKIQECWAKIWQSLLGLIIMIASFAAAALIGAIFFGDARALLNPVIQGAVVPTQ